MRDAVSLLSLNALFMAAGAGLVRALGLPFRGSWLPSSIGLTPAVGLLVCSLVAATCAAVGISISIYLVGLVAGLLIVLGWQPGWLRLRIPRPGLGTLGPRVQTRVGLAVEVVLLWVFGLFVFRLLALFSVLPVGGWDGWAIWSARAHALFAAGDVWSPAFQDTPYLAQHPEYPILFPTLEALSLGAIGRFDAALLLFEPGVLLAAAGLAVWALLRLAVAPWLAALAAVGLVGLDPIVENFRGNYADGATAVVTSLGLLCLTLWLVHDGSALLLTASLFLASAALVKNEGLMFACVAVVAAALACPFARRSPRPLLWVAGAIFVASVPWQVFLRLNGLPTSSTHEFSSLADPSYIAANAGRLGTASDSLLEALADVWALPALAGLIAFVAAAAAGRYALVVLFGAWTGVGFAGLAVNYLASTIDLNWLLATSGERVVGTLAIGMAVTSPVLAASAWSARQALDPHGRPGRDDSASAHALRRRTWRRRKV